MRTTRHAVLIRPRNFGQSKDSKLRQWRHFSRLPHSDSCDMRKRTSASGWRPESTTRAIHDDRKWALAQFCERSNFRTSLHRNVPPRARDGNRTLSRCHYALPRASRGQQAEEMDREEPKGYSRRLKIVTARGL